jgi:hypothetical protein
MDQLIEWARGNTSAASRNDLYGQIQNLMALDVPIIPLYQEVSYAVTKLDVSAVNLDITQFIRYSYVMPEFQSAIVLLVSMAVILAAVMVRKQKVKFHRKTRRRDWFMSSNARFWRFVRAPLST